MKIALAQINPIVGDITGNSRLIQRDLERASDAGADLVVFPEMSILGYPPKDLLLKPSVIDQCGQAVEQLAGQCTGLSALIGLPTPSTRAQGRPLHNAAAFCQHGQIVHTHIKSLLPTYDVFDESRYFEPGPRLDLTPFDGRQLGISVCEDLWNDEHLFSRQLYHDNPVHELAQRGADLFINAAASPFIIRKQAFRLRLMRQAAQRYGLPLVYTNQVGGNDELVFDGNSCAFDAHGNLLAHAKGFEEDLIFVDIEPGQAEPTSAQDQPKVLDAQRWSLDSPSKVQGPKSKVEISNLDHDPAQAKAQSSLATQDFGPWALDFGLSPVREAYHALVLGLSDYCRKCGFERLVLGLSGGIDSAVTCAIAVAALGREKVTGIAMPSRHSSQGSVSDAQALADSLGITLHVIPIQDIHAAFETMLEPHFQGLEPDITEENLQARIRGNLLMAFSNKFHSLLVNTGNKSELAVGYTTLYGDMCGGFSVLSDVPKMMVYDLAQWINTDADSPLARDYAGPVIPEKTLTKPPSAELRPDQSDQDTLPDYAVLDQVIERYVEREQSVGQIIEQTGFDSEMVLRVAGLIDRNEYKRKQTPPGLKITGRAFGFGRRMPIAQRFDNRLAYETAKS